MKAYVYLLTESWLQIPRATLPMDDKELASMARVDEHKWNAEQTQIGRTTSVKDEVLRCFKEGTCNEHKGRFFNERLLEESRKSENKQRFKNKNAKRTRSKRKVNAAPEYANASANDNDKGNWRTDFKIYKKSLSDAVAEISKDDSWRKDREYYHPGLDVMKTLEKALNDFWIKEKGWKHKKKSKSKELDWESTFNNTLTLKSNQVWKPRGPR